jgi:hypothetical protein
MISREGVKRLLLEEGWKWNPGLRSYVRGIYMIRLGGFMYTLYERTYKVKEKSYWFTSADEFLRMVEKC